MALVRSCPGARSYPRRPRHIYNNARQGILVDNSEAATIPVRNNIVYYRNISGGVLATARSVTEDHNLSSDPRLVNAAAVDFRLQPTSPAIDAGSPAAPFTSRSSWVAR